MNPALILAAIAGGASGVLVNVIFNSGLVSPASPGSIIAILGMCKGDSYLGVILSVIVATAVSWFIASIILKRSKTDVGDLEEAKSQVSEIKAAGKQIPYNQLRKIVFACDAGMGSSAMGAALLTKKLKAAGIEIDVPHYAINDIPKDTEVVVTHESLVERVRGDLPEVVIFPITNFMGGSEYDEIVNKLK